ncbi:MAG: ATP-binding protein [Bacteroidetes bacterium]|nr:ATP-binding protein [Bacteroidota bacterium]
MMAKLGSVQKLKKWLAEGEHLQQDFKFLVSDARKIARTLCSFANSVGGRILIGVKDNGVVSGIRSDEEFYMIQTASSLFTSPPVPFQTQVFQVNGKQVLCVSVAASKQRPHRFRNEEEKRLVYVRMADRDVRADAVLIKTWALEKWPRGEVRKIGASEIQLLEFLKDNPYITLSKCRKVTGLNYRNSVELLATLLRWNVIEAIPHLEGLAYRTNPN